MSNFFNRSFEQRSGIEKNLIVFGTIGALVGTFFGVKKVIKRRKEKKAENDYIAQVKNEQEAFEQSGEKLTYPPSNYKQFADQLQEAMQYTGTYFGVIYGIMRQMRNNLDVIQLVKAFGTRPIYFWGFTYNFTLPEALRDELSETDINKINNLFRAKKIKYRF
jgi:hypothetical protein